jgi:predicted nucleic acid-binding protein
VIIADTSAILATIDADSASHLDCVDVLANIRRPMLVSPMVIAETDYLLTTRFGVTTANRFLADVGRGAWELVNGDAQDINDVVTINTRYQHLKLGATDCLNVVLAARQDMSVIFTLDHRHYRVVRPIHGPAAFTLLPADRDDWVKSLTTG